jgi:hypothetical protein
MSRAKSFSEFVTNREKLERARLLVAEDLRSRGPGKVSSFGSLSEHFRANLAPQIDYLLDDELRPVVSALRTRRGRDSVALLRAASDFIDRSGEE